MSIVKYKVGNKVFSFSTELQVVNLLAVETCLIEEIKNHMRLNEQNGIMHDISIEDDNGILATAKNFEKVCSLTIKKIEK